MPIMLKHPAAATSAYVLSWMTSRFIHYTTR